MASAVVARVVKLFWRDLPLVRQPYLARLQWFTTLLFRGFRGSGVGRIFFSGTFPCPLSVFRSFFRPPRSLRGRSHVHFDV